MNFIIFFLYKRFLADCEKYTIVLIHFIPINTHRDSTTNFLPQKSKSKNDFFNQGVLGKGECVFFDSDDLNVN